MRCPRCTGRELQVGIILTGIVTCRFQDDGSHEVIDAAPFDSYWDSQSSCECRACRWSGFVVDAAEDATDLSQIADFDLAEY